MQAQLFYIPLQNIWLSIKPILTAVQLIQEHYVIRCQNIKDPSRYIVSCIGINHLAEATDPVC